MAPHVEEPVLDQNKDLEEPVLKTRAQLKYTYVQVAEVVVLHVLTVYTLLFQIQHMKIWTIVYAIVLVMLAVLGTTAGAHRLWCHHSYKATLPLRFFLFCCFALCSHVSIYDWVQYHRIHHKYADTEADPHNAKRGFFYAHIGWFMLERTPQFEDKKKEIDMSDILSDPLARFHSRFFTEITTLLLFLPSIVPIYVWGEDPLLSFLASGILRAAGAVHCIESINSFAHMYGIRPYNKRIQPTESAMVSFFSLGEGWHNYHHTFPWDYKAAEFGDRLNLTARFLEICAKLGLAHDLKTVSPDMITRMKGKYGDGSHVY